jgi:hypothetical protein
MTVRLFDPKTRLWSIYWADSNGGKFDPPVVGSFENNVGHFFTKDIFNGKAILVIFRWDARDKENPTWSQAFSEDSGKTPKKPLGIFPPLRLDCPSPRSGSGRQSHATHRRVLRLFD